MIRKITTKEMLKMDVLELYKLVLDNNLKFPSGYWTYPKSKEKGIMCTRYLINERLKLTDEEVKKLFSVKFLEKYMLYDMLRDCFGSSPYSLINEVFPRRFNEWEFSRVPSGFWNLDNSIDAVRWLVERVLQLSDDEVLEKLTRKDFKDNKLGYMLKVQFKGDPYIALEAAYPNKYETHLYISKDDF